MTGDVQRQGAVLIVDESSEVRDALHRLLHRDHDVLTARDAEEARALLATRSVQVVIADARRSISEPLTLFKSLRRTHPEIVRVLLAGLTTRDATLDATRQGHVDRYLIKPWRPDEVRLCVQQALEQHQTRLELVNLRARLVHTEQELELQRTHSNTMSAARGELDLLKNAFMEVVSHELNTPIAIILGYTFLLRRELGDEPSPVIQKSIDRIESGSRRLKRISDRVFKMLDSANPGAQIDTDTLDLRELASALHKHVEPFLQERKQRLVTTIDPNAHTLQVDPEKLQDICFHLVMNAIKFSPDGATITLRASASPDRPDHVDISIIDQGIGINDEDLPHVFDMFFCTFTTGHHSSGEYEFDKRGIGLGLAIVKRFAQQHGGSARAERNDGPGMTFTVTLPRRA